jgi:hypothetical protein
MDFEEIIFFVHALLEVQTPGSAQHTLRVTMLLDLHHHFTLFVLYYSLLNRHHSHAYRERSYIHPAWSPIAKHHMAVKIGRCTPMFLLLSNLVAAGLSMRVLVLTCPLPSIKYLDNQSSGSQMSNCRPASAVHPLHQWKKKSWAIYYIFKFVS